MTDHALRFAEIVNNDSFDLVLAHSCRWFYTPFVARFLQLPSVLYLHEPCRWLYETDGALPWIAEPDSGRAWWHPHAIRHWLASSARVHSIRAQGREENVSIRAFRRVLVNSRFSRESLLRAFGVDATVCYPGVDTSVFSPDGVREDFVLSVGEFAKHKNPLFLIRAVAACRRKPTLVWVANNVDEVLFRSAAQLAEKLGVRIDLQRNVSETALIHFHRRASLFLYAPRLEPFGLGPLEALSCGTPVIAVAEGGVRETVVHMETGILVDSDPNQMADAIDLLLDHPTKAAELGANGMNRVRALWSDESAVDRLERALESVLTPAGR